MTFNQLLLCTDMDRTIIPNGVQPEHEKARKRFTQFCRSPDITLAYVTGRHLQLVKDAIRIYQLPTPDFVVTDVGTKIFHYDNDDWNEIQQWSVEIAKDWQGFTHQELKKLLSGITALQLQESSKQSQLKLSYYAPLHTNTQQLFQRIEERLEPHKIQASLIWSIDEPKGIGLLDILPKNATKLHAIEFLQSYLGFSANEIMFAGDSGNDLPVATSPIPSVLVANTAKDVQEQAKDMASQNQQQAALYISSGANSEMNGNYSAGVLEGIGHFFPDLHTRLSQLGFQYD